MARTLLRSLMVVARVALGLLVALGGARDLLADSGEHKVSVAALAPLLARGVTLIDIRRPDEWRATGVIAGSHLITAFGADGQLRPTFVAEVAAVSPPDRPVALLCRSGNRSAHAQRLLQAQNGFRAVYDVTGGINAWLRAEQPVEPCERC